ncbi:MAG: aminotransferase class V-fold PLP-dependent enzyme [Planctomycetes bacterium]|nr:aminotransferase class V-fold PLP-dependent enzyme [Planctomycetota bacterium]
MIYLDHAATSRPKAPGVVEAMTAWYRELGVSAERGDSRLTRTVAGQVRETRERLGRLCGVPARQVAFGSGATESINLFLRGFLARGDRVLTTQHEHSAVARPLRALQRDLGIRVEVLPLEAGCDVMSDQVAAALAREPARLLVFSHASNVTGRLLDAPALTRVARAAGTAVLVDACQSAGIASLDFGADAVAASAHKSLLGPPGLGFLAVREGVPLRSAKQGGTGSSRALDQHPESWPHVAEAGTPNTPAILGLGAALAWGAGHDAAACGARLLALLDQLASELESLGARIHSARTGARVPILSFTMPGLDPAEIGALLDDAGIHVRTGFHCAPWVHAALGTEAAGVVRISAGPFTAADELRAPARALARR